MLEKIRNFESDDDEMKKAREILKEEYGDDILKLSINKATLITISNLLERVKKLEERC